MQYIIAVFFWRDWGNPQRTSLGIVSISLAIPTDHVLNACQKYTVWFSSIF